MTTSTKSADSSRYRGIGALATYYLSLVMIGLASSAIYWPSGLLIVGVMMWLDLFVTSLIVLLKRDLTERRREE